ncbi:hypothetical protein CRYUN_Cryun02cG0153100 [Craigia yunnanensis]
MTVIDILFLVDEICKKYEKYDPKKQHELNAFGDDAFARLFALVEADIEKKSEMVSMEKNRAAAVALSCEVRRIKARLMEEIPKLQKLAKMKVKGISKEDQETRFDLVLVLPERIKAIPDGSMTAANQTGGRGASSSNKNIKFDSTKSDQFREEYEMRKMKQACKDEGLDIISEGLDTLKNIALDMNEEIDRQVPLMDEIDTKATSDIQRTNVRLKKTVTQIRSSQNFCIDIILLCVILGIASHMYK